MIGLGSVSSRGCFSRRRGVAILSTMAEKIAGTPKTSNPITVNLVQLFCPERQWKVYTGTFFFFVNQVVAG